MVLLGPDVRRLPRARASERRRRRGTFLLPAAANDAGRHSRNVFRIQRLKDKLGNKSNASAEIELDGTHWRR